MLMCSETGGSKPFQCSTVQKNCRTGCWPSSGIYDRSLRRTDFFLELRPETRKWPGNDLYPLTTPWLGGRKPRNWVAKSWKCLQFLAYGVPNRHPAQKTETEKFSTHRLDSKGKLPASITSTALYIYTYIQIIIYRYI
jgi:hypothetical protein